MPARVHGPDENISLSTRKQVYSPGCIWAFQKVSPGSSALVGVPVKRLFFRPTPDLLSQSLCGKPRPQANLTTAPGDFYTHSNYKIAALKFKEICHKGVKNSNTLD